MCPLFRTAVLVLALSPLPALSGASPWELDSPLSAAPDEIRASAVALPVEPGTKVRGLFAGLEMAFDEQARVTRVYRGAYRIETDPEGWDSLTATWSPWHQARPEIRARVIDKDGTEHWLDPTTIGEYSSEDGDDLVYGDNRMLRAPLPTLGPGAVVEYAITTRDTEPFFPAGQVLSFRIDRAVPNLRTRVFVDAPESLALRAVLVGLTGIEPTVQLTSGRRRTTFDIDRMIKSEEFESGRPPDAAPFPAFTISTASSWAAVAGAYAEIVDRQLEGTDLATQVKTITKGARTRDEKVARLLSALHDKIRYTGVEFGDAALVPRTPSEVMTRGYGDCKDKSALLVAMLRTAGIQAHVAVLSTGPGRDVDPDLPGMGVFDHAIVYVPGPEPLWLDATAEFAALGEIPLPDQGRHALVASRDTTDLINIPETTSTSNTELETREVYLAESGPGRVVETTEATGSIARNHRDEFQRVEEQAFREDLENYARSSYKSKSIGAAKLSDVSDLAVPFRLEMEALQCSMAKTERTDAAVSVNAWNLLLRLRETLDYNHDDPPAKPRQSDLYFYEPHRVTWRWVVTPALGYATAKLPENSEIQMGKAVLTSVFEKRPDGGVIATFTVDSGPRRWTAADVDAARTALRKFGDAPAVVLAFEQVGEAHLAAGRIAEALAEFRRLALAQPKSASPLARLSRALLEAGVGEAARTTARRAVAIDPESAVAYQALGWVLEHDLVGRRFGKGWDRAGSLAAYRKSRQLDPTDVITRADLAILLEHDEDGNRYTAGAQLDEAIVEYRSLREDLDNQSLNQNLLVDLGRTGRYAETRELAESLAASAMRNGWLLAAIAAEHGAAAAIAESSRVAPNATDRSTALLTAGEALVALRKYEAAAALLMEGAQGAKDPVQTRTRANILSRTRRHEEIPIDETDPKSIVRQFMSLALSSPLRSQELTALFSPAIAESVEKMGEERFEEDFVAGIRPVLNKSNLSPGVMLDLIVSMVQTALDGDDSRGYRVRLILAGEAGRAPTLIYVTKQDGRYKLAGFSGVTHVLTLEIRRRLQASDLDGARQWLDWARDEIAPAGGDDPLAGHPFPQFWTKGEKGDSDRIRAAAACLAANNGDDKHVVPTLNELREKAVETDRGRFDWALALAFDARRDAAAALAVSTRLLNDNPRSDFALRFAVRQLATLKRLDEAEQMVATRLASSPDDINALRLRGDLYFQRGKYAEREDVQNGLIQRGFGSAIDYNALAWSRLVRGVVDTVTIDSARTAVQLEQHRFHRHTLAAVLAEAGQLPEARQLVLQLMEERAAQTPDSEEWYVFGRIAEQYGERDSAVAYYRNVKLGKGLLPQETSFGLAQQRIAALGVSEPTPAGKLR